jgi:hypothetical protein
MGILTKLALVTLLAVPIGGCNRMIDAHGGPVIAGVPSAGLFIEGECVTRHITVTDPVTGELKPIRQRFCGGRPIPATDRGAAAPLAQSARRSFTPSGAALGSSAPACDAQAALKKNAASPSEIANSPPGQGPE